MSAVCTSCREPLSEAGTCDRCESAGLNQTVAASPPVAQIFGDFEVARRVDGSLWELGRGAMGVTYKAVDRVLHRSVALKVIAVPADADRGHLVRERFLREARAAAALRHANIAGIYQCGTVGEGGSSCFYAMELVEGETLDARVRRDGPLPAETALEIGYQVAAALSAAAHQGLIHRDLKPANLMLTQDDQGLLEVKVIDFGLAKAVAATAEADLTQGGFVGTANFASPEQFEQGAIDARSDLYSLGVTLWFVLTGRVPFSAKTVAELRDRQAQGKPPVEQLTARKVPPEVILLLRSLLEVDPSDRPATARELMSAIQVCRGRTTSGLTSAARGSPGVPPATRAPWIIGASALIVVLVAAAGWWAFAFQAKDRAAGGAGIPLAVPEKSIAVLPFDNLSDDKANEYFAQGIQDEILTDLSKIAALKVTSRTSVMSYATGHQRNMREIGAALGVAHVLEGNVQKAGGLIRVTAKLIDTRNDAYVWSDHFDGDMSDVFKIQTQMAQQIAENLRMKLSPDEKAAMDVRPTADLVTYNLYLRGKDLVLTYPQTQDWKATLLEAVNVLDEAIARDSHFALAYCVVAKAHDQLNSLGLDASPARLALQEKAVATALELQPNLGDAHLARALLLYHGHHDPAGARAELLVARVASPNDPEVSSLSSYIYRREGRWQEALDDQARALSLDPRNYSVLNDQTVIYDMLRRYPEEVEVAGAAIAAVPPAAADYFRLLKAGSYLSAGQTAPARAELQKLAPGNDPNGAATFILVSCALDDNNPNEAKALLAKFTGTEYSGDNGFITPRAWLEACVARAAGDETGAQQAFLRAREVAQMRMDESPDYAPSLALLAKIDAGLGRREAALAEGKRAVEMLPIGKDAMDGPGVSAAYALVCAWTGETDEALRQLDELAKIPGGPDYGQLRYSPIWKGLRDRPEFAAMLAMITPKEPIP